MQITVVEITDFRNYERQTARLCPFVNLIIGGNAQGKTNLLEALYLCAVGKSPRTSKDKDLIRWGAERAKTKVEAQKKYGTDKVEIIIEKVVNKRIAINGMPITKMGELMGVVQTVFFSPDEMRIIKDAPSDRRRFIDIALCQISRSYFYLLSRYDRIVSQRNKLIKSGQATADSIDLWDTQLAEAGSLIVKTRRGFVSALNQSAKSQHLFLTDNKEELSLVYESIDGQNKEEIQANFIKELYNSRERDLRLGYTNVGPHKDDMGVFINNIDARKFASQGQQRTAALSLKLAEIDLAATERGETPILLLDDVMGELDLDRRRKLLERIKGLQAVITCTHLDKEIIDALGQHKVFRITNGVIEETHLHN